MKKQLEKFQDKLNSCQYVQSDTQEFKGRFKFFKVKVNYVDNFVRVFFYDKNYNMLYSCLNYEISRIYEDTIYINC